MPGRTFKGRALVAGSASGDALVLDEPLSFWGGIDPATGRVVEPRHPQWGAQVAGKVLVMPSGRGSSSSSSVLAEAIRLGTAPAAIVLRHLDGILALGVIVARELYGTVVPIVVLEGPLYARLSDGDRVAIDGGNVTLARGG